MHGSECARGQHLNRPTCLIACSTTANTQLLPLDDLLFVFLSGHSRPLTAGSDSERCASAWEVRENKLVSAAAALKCLLVHPHSSDSLQKCRALLLTNTRPSGINFYHTITAKHSQIPSHPHNSPLSQT